MWGIDNTEFFLNFLVQYYARYATFFFRVISFLQVFSANGAWSMISSSVERKCTYVRVRTQLATDVLGKRTTRW